MTNTLDSGPGSLRQALFYASLSNSAPPDTIDFDIPGSGPFLITPLSPLPAVDHPTIIDGYSQPGSSTNTLAQGDDAHILIQVDGSMDGYNDGFDISAGDSTVTGLSLTDFFNNAINMTGPGGDLITGDWIGVDPTGTLAEGNSAGLTINNSGSNTIGGTTPAARNVVSNNFYGIQIGDGSSSNQVFGNFIGTDPTGLLSMGNTYGVLLANAPDTAIGSPLAGAGNVMSSNYYAVYTYNDYTTGIGPDNSTIQGNLIGTDATGEGSLGNLYDGLLILGGNNLLIGGSAPADGNVISGTRYGDGIDLETNSALIQGNKIGTDATGTSAFPNSQEGIDLFYYSSGITIGGTTAGAGNIISNNGLSGIYSLTGNTLIQGNTIDTNTNDGITLAGYEFWPSADNSIGGTAAGAGNVIGNNGGAGVNILDPDNSGLNVGNAILSNSIYGNAALGIDLGGNGVTMNHSGGLISGPNGYQNYPVLSSAVSTASQTTIDGSLNAAANETFTIQFFSNTAADPTGFGQGQTYLGSISVTTNSAGNVTFSATFNVSVASGLSISATATDPNGNTSEFSQDITVSSSTAAKVARSAVPATASVDQALESLLLGVIDQATLNALAGTLPKGKPRTSGS